MISNIATYNSPPVVKWYAGLQGLMAAESAIFGVLSERISNANVLDIGVGGGRTTSFFNGRCKNYVGIDYADNQVISVKSKFPSLQLHCMDARQLDFPDRTFDFVNFSFNGLDYVDFYDRQKILAEVWRVMKPEGTFFFSTHNMSHRTFNSSPWQEGPVWVRLKNIGKLFFPYLRARLYLKHSVLNEDYAIINDHAHGYRLMTFYTTPLFLRQMLTDAGFTNITLYDNIGSPAPDQSLGAWIFATAERPVL